MFYIREWDWGGIMGIILGVSFISSILILFVLLIINSCEERDYVRNYVHVGREFNPQKHDIEYYFIEETAEWKKYKVRNSFITVKNDTIVAVWRKH